MRKTTIVPYLISICFLGFFACAPEKLERTGQNIIMFLVDDMGWQDTSVPFWKDSTHFNKLYRTPNMEHLASEGMKFTQAYACAVCSPTRVSLMTGMNAARHRVTNWTLRYNVSQDNVDDQLVFPPWNVNSLQTVDTIPQSVYATTLPSLLKEAGYFTIHTGKAHFGTIGTPGSDPRNLGFDINIAGHAAGAPASFQGLDNFGNDENGHPTNDWAVPGMDKYHGKDINLTKALTIEAIHAMDSAIEVDKPFYLYMAHYTVHAPIQPDHPFYPKYKAMGLEEPEARYASMLEGMDESLGDLMQFLKDRKIDDQTTILFMSDNGGLSARARGGVPHTHNWPLNSGKGSAYEGGIREPMIVRWPGKTPPGSNTDGYVIIEDFFPTILEMAGVKTYKTIQSVDGRSFVQQLLGDPVSNDERPLYWHYPNKWGAFGPGIGTSSTIRLGDWKLIYFYSDSHFELYNIEEDIFEKQNLAEVYPEKVKALAMNLSDYLRKVDAQRPTYAASNQPVPWPDEVEL